MSRVRDTPANIAHDNRVAMDFLTAHNAPPEFWEQAGYEDPNRTVMRAPGVPPLLDAMEREREDRIRNLSRNLSSAPQSPVVPPPPTQSGSPSSSVPSLESCSSSSDGGEDPEEEGSEESDDAFWTALSTLGQSSPGPDEVEGGGRGSPRPLWVRISELGVDGREMSGRRDLYSSIALLLFKPITFRG
ncbi:hypothetical protein BJ322DRAFT_1109212 [Thelephora terrestris]|uniref:Uncharacterized protein n=1 Tax=Thelephora terrestris TaxID=56493 RepID=A0A9P6L671_9AGAM|nr:hypothetical protein BJ322DRAFT_1109205 [Thelephora terrestris]KAF9784492.1 hypothetical protein BJ322DRAFT_1109212 [Thelephora terrestris]